ncbi:2OG-Fe(II)oxygenase superfamily protein [Colletotrichum scovillei]|uniref:2OG-Fe(II)oxygenase superfamily protein n=1 Tax=Colletotrichum scovillei TaxID=1209932 RepID=A0A9P7UDI8_9PEZI|nr:2OG-Fe(II)oxygenase superfamily protein [Colletotrichum scovillei]KAG7071059.1 2OG-Fe(II)oxygenase superfamily protein [Colletotrichum scovillei]KAG7079303.1 2OG-Fe(II)oxygenase superfamily protein [Colletotrichum scovillei]
MSSGQRRECSVDEQNGIGADTDVKCFTIVTQDSSGSPEVLSKSGHWIKADPTPGAFVVNIAGCFMRRTDDFFVSTINRAINKSGSERGDISCLAREEAEE